MNDPKAAAPTNLAEVDAIARAEGQAPPAAPPSQKVQVFAIFPDLMDDVRNAIRCLPHNQADQIIKRLSQCQILQVDVTQAPQGSIQG